MSDDAGGIGDLFDRRTVVQIVLGFAVAGLVLSVLVEFVGTRNVLDRLATADLRWLAMGCLSTLLCLTFWGKAWQIVLDVAGVRESFRRLVVTYYAATFANYVTPLGQAGGEPFIAYVLSRDTDASYEDALASVVTADLLNLFPFVTFSGVGFAALLYQSSLPAVLEPLAVALFAVALGVPVLAAVGWRYRLSLRRVGASVVVPIVRLLPRLTVDGLRSRLAELDEAFNRIATDRRALVRALGYSYVGWIFFALPLYFVAMAVGDAAIPLLLVFFIVPASTLGGLAPSPGGSGAVEAFLVILIVALTPIASDGATAISILYRVASYVFALLVGGAAAVFVLRRSYSNN
ncbi:MULTISPECIES: lysylphosphatidylglycerol synthase transmembrane domain-containing protein [Halomicrobium]|uniref:Flippase-like domain-containing protein n=2 Tax=Halomicrobium mukohataei TaxID=57705 RepID=C7P1Z9_HALMD|nr:MULTISPECIES: lysylphosphatidylglycerol synthase transmembrane domain-containing protein [Halomicrobium]ACV47228.1 conserved hypothetical protein [Halomicrobium mukohataei DSM 12286]QCD65701.1 flippase-like domain-containing protein [Halomicrobium mukohataei]QFR20507.1 flippase-like domain-containing protein [Halomicrobium sp. ZPS1]